MRDNLERPIGEVALAEGVALEDDWYALRAVDAGTLAIGEPAYHQCNWSYLIADAGEALLWDTGSGRRPIAPLVARHARGGIRAFSSHMHFDHLGGIADFGPAVVADLPMLRAVAADGRIAPTPEMFLGAVEGLELPVFEVGQWVAPGAALRVGARRLKVLHTPGHSPDSVSLWEAERDRLYAADFVYRGELYAQTPGASLPDYARVLRELLGWLPRDVQILCAHGQQEGGVFDMPALGYGDLEDTLRAVEQVLAGAAHAGEQPVNGHMVLLYSAESFTG